MSAVLPTIFHITHVKSGSQWVAEILKQCAPQRFVPARANPQRVTPLLAGRVTPGSVRQRVLLDPNNHHLRSEPIRVGGVYGAVYTDREYFEHFCSNAFLPKTYAAEFLQYPRRVTVNWWQFGVRKFPFKHFLVIRDLRDMFVSLYFSVKVSHAIMYEKMSDFRSSLSELNEEDGLLYLMEHNPALFNSAAIQASWLQVDGVPCFRYEDLLDDPFTHFERMIDHCEIDVTRERLRDIIANNQFEAASGRRRGEEDITSHYRKGIAGDWKNHFTERVKAKFKGLYGSVLIDTGYEGNMDW